MKRIIAILLSSIAIISALFGCSAPPATSQAGSSADNPVSTPPIAQSSTPEPSMSQTTAPAPEIVEVTLPADLFDGADAPEPDVDQFLEEEGCLDVVFNEDGSVTLVFTKEKYNEILAEQLASTRQHFDEIIESKTYITSIEHNQDMTTITMKVIRAEYEVSFDLTPFSLFFEAMFYQILLKIEIGCEILVVDVDTDETITSVILPVTQ